MRNPTSLKMLLRLIFLSYLRRTNVVMATVAKNWLRITPTQNHMLNRVVNLSEMEHSGNGDVKKATPATDITKSTVHLQLSIRHVMVWIVLVSILLAHRKIRLNRAGQHTGKKSSFTAYKSADSLREVCTPLRKLHPSAKFCFQKFSPAAGCFRMTGWCTHQIHLPWKFCTPGSPDILHWVWLCPPPQPHQLMNKRETPQCNPLMMQSAFRHIRLHNLKLQQNSNSHILSRWCGNIQDLVA